MVKNESLALDGSRLVNPLCGGVFVSSGVGIHGDRVMDSFELIFVKKGTLAMSEDARAFDLSAGQTLLLWPGRHHRGTEPYPPDLEFYYVHFQVPTHEKKTFSMPINVPQLATLNRPSRLVELFRTFLEHQQAGRLTPSVGGALIVLMLCEVAEPLRPEPGQHASALALANQAVSYIEKHFDEPISTSNIAKALGYNADYLGRVFRRVHGHTLTEHLHLFRIRRACDLFRNTWLNVDQVARESGFGEVGYFRQIFKRYTGMPPRAYRCLRLSQ